VGFILMINPSQMFSSLFQFDLSLPMDDDFDDNPPSLDMLPVMSKTGHEGFSRSDK
jgi:hypothetical protein